MSYRLGADPERHGATDCLHLVCSVLRWQGIEVPTPERSWYRRLRRGDTSIFQEELERWGREVDRPKLAGTVALCHGEAGYGLAVFREEGFLHCLINQVRWSPTNHLPVAALYCRSR